MSLTWSFTVDGVPAGQQCWPARISIPVPKGEGKGKTFAVRLPDGSMAPAQARTLVPWPDGSPRWVQLDFQATGAGAHVAEMGTGGSEVALPVSILKNDSAYTVSIGRLQVTIDPATGDPIDSINWNGRQLASQGNFGVFRVIDEGARIYAPIGDPQNLSVEADGLHRFQLSWETEHRDQAGNPSVSVRFRLEFLAGVEGFVFSYQFFHKIPGRDYLHLHAIESRFALPGLQDPHGVVLQANYSNLGSLRVVRTKKTVPLLIDKTHRSPYVENIAIIDDDFQYPYFLNNAHEMVPIAGLEDATVAMVTTMRNLPDQRPKTVYVGPDQINYDIWPESAGTLKLPQGRSSAQQFTFLFTDPEQVNDLPTLRAAANLEPAQGWLDPADSVHAGATWDASWIFTGQEPGAAIFHTVLNDATHSFNVASGMFDIGDSPQIGYTQCYAGGGFWPNNERPTRELPFHAGLGGESYSLPSMIPIASLTPVWSNNEYDALYCLALQALRTKSQPVLRKLQAACRHQIEVDFVHYSDHWQHHRGTPCHTYDHNACSTAYPSHQWTQGLYYYYCMTGDDDVPEVVRAIGDYNIMWFNRPELQFAHGFNRELGWDSIALVFCYEMTADAKYLEAAKQVIDEEIGFSGMKEAGENGFGNYEKVIGTSFVYNTILMGLCFYHKATGEDWAQKLIERWVHIGFGPFNEKTTGVKICDMFPECYGYVYQLTGDTHYLEESLWQLLLFLYGYANPWRGVPVIDAKMYGRVYRGLTHFISHCAKAGLLPKVEKQFLGETAKG